MGDIVDFCWVKRNREIEEIIEEAKRDIKKLNELCASLYRCYNKERIEGKWLTKPFPQKELEICLPEMYNNIKEALIIASTHIKGKEEKEKIKKIALRAFLVAENQASFYVLRKNDYKEFAIRSMPPYERKKEFRKYVNKYSFCKIRGDVIEILKEF